MIYLDANFFVFALLDKTQRGDKARKLQEEVASGKKAATSSLTMDEIMRVLIKNGKQELLRACIEDIYSIPNLEIVPVPPLVPLKALDFIEKFGLKPRDAFHAAIMDDLNIREIASDDAHFDRIKGIRRIKFD